jgi:mono/diheme cytochrome c family protein
MMRLILRRPAATHVALGVIVWACALAGTFSSTGHARQSRSAEEGVYSAAQATRGQQTYQAECLVCHGDTLDGGVGPMLAGEGFLTVWSARPLSELVDKIQNTMPVQAPGSLSREQATDITAYILQAGRFPAGQADLTVAMLPQVAFPAVAAPEAPTAAAGGIALAPAANLAQLMRGVTFPNANILFNAQVRDYGAERPSPPVPFDYYKWGSTVYFGWQAADQAALSLIETTPLFLVPGRRCENGRPAPVDRADYKQFTADLIAVAQDVYRATQTRNIEAVSAITERLNDTCANCHQVYRDGAAEGQSAGVARCQ